jgi:hypothetical protein
MAMKTSTVLKRAKKLLETKGWTQRTKAVDKHGAVVSPASRKATRFGALGAVERVVYGTQPNHPLGGVYSHAELALWAALPRHIRQSGRGVCAYEDSARRTVADMLALFDSAIAVVEKTANEARDARNKDKARSMVAWHRGAERQRAVAQERGL